eukprot:gnl/TRDRNA2_/TRDRNA2_92608_c0_seq1.p1 gnl/TRDRNA2_/TRDRNA2_92608_c0~~gnl/TRDRNA2_/TRDRNA2_92608_c0_seq1.p1  ORF type:complete len:340 (-),score=51.11 gnl/TRDRNA2_/TRDRNA2_92608_c0_seq1:53-1072(-)
MAEPEAKRQRSLPPVWLDCDPGHDDAIAIILAGYRTNLLGISTVAGNQTVENTTINARRMCIAAGLGDIPVYKGVGRPLLRENKPDFEIHGKSGLDGSPALDALPLGTMLEGKAVLKMAEAIEASPEPVNLVATGCLTNVALFLRLYPELLPKVKQIVFMGGAVGVGNRSAAAEFNILCDPESARIVCDCGAKVVMVPLEVTHTALATDDVFAKIDAMATPFARMVSNIINFFREGYKKAFDFDSPPIHDPCAVAYVIDPSLFDAKLLRVDIECASELCAGRTVVDLHNQRQLGFLNEGGASRAGPNVHVALKMDVPAFWDIMLGAIQRASDRASPLLK